MRWTISLVVTASLALNSCKPRHDNGTALAAAEAAQLSVETFRQRVAAGAPNVGWVDVPLIRQSRSFTCGAASLASALYALGTELREGQIQRLARSAYDTGTDFRELMKVALAMNDTHLRDQMTNVRNYDEIFNPHTIMKSLSRSINEDYRSDHVTLPSLPKRSQAGMLTQGSQSEEEPFKSSKQITRRSHQIGLKSVSEPNLSVAVKFGYKIFNGPAPIDCQRNQSNELPGLKDLSNVTLERTSIKELEEAIKQGHPVIALIQAWGDLTPEQYEKAYDHGHYVVVNGFDEQNIYIMDPATLGQYTYMSRRDFERRWHDYSGSFSESTGERCPGGYEMHAFSMILKGTKNPDFDAAIFSRLD